jgi:NAD-dependent DNA ligase
MEDFSKYLPTECPYCHSGVSFDGIHLMCQNENCVGKIAKKLSSAASMLDLKNIGGKTLEPFAVDFNNMYDLMHNILLLEKNHRTYTLDKYGIKADSRSHEIFVKAFTTIKSLTYEQVIISLGYENVGKKLSLQIAKEHCGMIPDYTGLEKALVAMLHRPEVEQTIKSAVSSLEHLGVTIDKPKVRTGIPVCLTGSPKEFGYKSKEEFLNKFPGIVESDLKEAQYLITDSYDSTSSKMKVAEKRGVIIKTYGDFKL